jgi:hypothetical protein
VTRPEPELMCFIDQRPVLLLYLIEKSEEGETWMVKPIFTADQTLRKQFIRAGTQLRPIHTQSR